MKRFLVILSSFFTAMVFAQNITIPDANFKYYLTHHYRNGQYYGYDTNHDGEIDLNEANPVTSIDIHGKSSIQDITGIRNFTNLQNLNATNCKIVTFDLRDMTHLKTFSCEYNYNLTTSIDVSGCYNLTVINCGTNPITSVNLTGAVALKTFTARYNAIQSLDFSGMTQLEVVDISLGKVESANFTGVTTLKYLSASNNRLVSLSVPNNPNMTYLNCSYNLMTSLDVSGDVALSTLDCNYNFLETLRLDGTINVYNFNCKRNNLKTLDIKHMKKLENLDCSYNQIKALDLSDLDDISNSTRRSFDCSHNAIEALSFLHTKVNYIECGYNDFTFLDLSDRADLISLSCPHTKLNYLKITNNQNSPLIDDGNFSRIDLKDNYYLYFICSDSWQVTKYQQYLGQIGSNAKVSAQCDLKPILSPNPTYTATVLYGTEKFTSIKLYDLEGKLIRVYGESSSFEQYIDLSDVPIGIYIVEFTTASGLGNGTRKITKR